MSKFAPILAILLTVLSIAFMGFAGAATLGGPNWRAMASNMTDYQFVRGSGQDTAWSVTSRTGDNLKSSPVLPEVLVAALDDRSSQLQTKLGELDAKEPEVRQSLEDLDGDIGTDKEALNRHLEAQAQLLQQLGTEAANLSRQVVQKTEEGSVVEKEVSDRRSDVFRQQNQLEVLRADQARIEQIHRQMTDLIEQIDTDLDKARRRERQLRERLGEDY